MFCLLLTIAPIKLEITTIEKAIEQAPTADLHFRLAQAHLKDQEPDRAFLSFIEALDACEMRDEWELPEDTLQLYLQGKAVAAGDDLATNFLHAVTLANQGDFQGFFTHFFAAYPHFKGSFLDFKTRGILYLRLAQRTGNKKHYLEQAKLCLENALELEPRDGSLYRSLMSLDNDHLRYLETLASHDVIIQRQDILPFVEAALRLNCKEIAEVIVEKGKQLYSYSRSIEAAEKRLGRE